MGCWFLPHTLKQTSLPLSFPTSSFQNSTLIINKCVWFKGTLLWNPQETKIILTFSCSRTVFYLYGMSQQTELKRKETVTLCLKASPSLLHALSKWKQFKVKGHNLKDTQGPDRNSNERFTCSKELLFLSSCPLVPLGVCYWYLPYFSICYTQRGMDVYMKSPNYVN